MRLFLLLFPAILFAQTPPAASPAPAAKAAPKAAKPKSTKAATPASKAGTSAKTSTTAKAARGQGCDTGRGARRVNHGRTKNHLRRRAQHGAELSQLGLSRAELEIVKRALTDAAAGKPAIELSEWGPKINTFAQSRAAKAAEVEKSKSKAYLATAAAEPGAVHSPSGLVYHELAAGTGASPKATDKVRVNYRGTLVNGTEFDSSYKRNMPADFRSTA